jgi:hypothetical protein
MRFEVKANKPCSKIIAQMNGVDVGVTFRYEFFIKEELQGKIQNPKTGSYVQATYYVVRNSKMEYLPFAHFLQKVFDEKKENLSSFFTENNFINHKENSEVV